MYTAHVHRTARVGAHSFAAPRLLPGRSEIKYNYWNSISFHEIYSESGQEWPIPRQKPEIVTFRVVDI